MLFSRLIFTWFGRFWAKISHFPDFRTSQKSLFPDASDTEESRHYPIWDASPTDGSSRRTRTRHRPSVPTGTPRWSDWTGSLFPCACYLTARKSRTSRHLAAASIARQKISDTLDRTLLKRQVHAIWKGDAYVAQWRWWTGAAARGADLDDWPILRLWRWRLWVFLYSFETDLMVSAPP